MLSQLSPEDQRRPANLKENLWDKIPPVCLTWHVGGQEPHGVTLVHGEGDVGEVTQHEDHLLAQECHPPAPAGRLESLESLWHREESLEGSARKYREVYRRRQRAGAVTWTSSWRPSWWEILKWCCRTSTWWTDSSGPVWRGQGRGPSSAWSWGWGRPPWRSPPCWRRWHWPSTLAEREAPDRDLGGTRSRAATWTWLSLQTFLWGDRLGYNLGIINQISLPALSRDILPQYRTRYWDKGYPVMFYSNILQ